MPEIVLVQNEWVTNDGDFPYWAPQNHAELIGHIPLRDHTQCAQPGGTPQGFDLVVYSNLPAGLNGIVLGSDPEVQLTLVQRSFIQQELRTTVAETQLLKVIRELLLVRGDPSGESRWKGTCSTRQNGVKIKLGPYGLIVNEPLIEGDDAFLNTLAIRKLDYARNRGNGVPLAVLEKWNGYDMLKLFGRMGDDLLPALVPMEYLDGRLGRDGWRSPTTTLTDDFNRSNESLDAGNWVEIAGGWAVVSNQAQNDGGANSQAYYATPLSSADHYAQCALISGGHHGVTCRKANSGTITNYHADFDAATKWRSFRRNSGTYNSIGSNTTTGRASGDVIKFTIDGSNNFERFKNGSSQNSGTDGSPITGNLYCGITSGSTTTTIDDWEAGDLAAGGGFAHSQAVIIG